MNTIDQIFSKAEELAKLIQSHEYAKRYSHALSLMKNDDDSRDVYARLVDIGKVIAQAKETGAELGEDFFSENEKLKSALAGNELVKEFIESQRLYFQMMSDVQKRISIIS